MLNIDRGEVVERIGMLVVSETDQDRLSDAPLHVPRPHYLQEEYR